MADAAALADDPASLVDALPSVVAYYSDGSAALAADFYDDAREAAGAPGRFRAEPVVDLRVDAIRAGAAWSLKASDTAAARERLAQVVQLETARPYRDTVTVNRRRDPGAVGWRRVASGGCKFCRLLAGRGEVYSESTARFASHPHCGCTAEPVFKGGMVGPEASPLQYVASRRRRTEKQRQALRDYLAAMPD
jgi:hypothetical protein